MNTQNNCVCIGPYKIGATLGVGTFGKVKLAVHITTGVKVAIKIINKARMQHMDMQEKIRREIDILRQLRHPHVIRLYELIDTPTDLFMVMEYAPGGELFDYIVSKSRLHENEARRFFQQIVAGVEYCHNNMICHRDLKPENLLLDSNLHIKIADFGLSNIMRDGDFLRTSCGSPNYASPEVVSGKAYAGPEVDIWSCGVVLYALLCGTLPFDDEHVARLFKKIKMGSYTLPGHLTESARSLINRLLVVDPCRRLSCKEIRRHPWMRIQMPLYLSVPLKQLSLNQIDQSIVQELIQMGIDINKNAPTGNALVAYDLLSDSRARLQSYSTLLSPNLKLELSTPFDKEILKRAALLYALLDLPPSPALLIGSCVVRHFGVANPLLQSVCVLSSPYVSYASHFNSPLNWSSDDRRGEERRGEERRGEEGRWQLGIEASMEGATLMTIILKTLKNISYEWYMIHPYKVRCRPRKALVSEERGDEREEGRGEERKGEENRGEEEGGEDRGEGAFWRINLTIALYKVGGNKYIVDIQIFDGPLIACLSECLIVTTAIYSSLRSFRQDRGGGGRGNQGGETHVTGGGKGDNTQTNANGGVVGPSSGNTLGIRGNGIPFWSPTAPVKFQPHGVIPSKRLFG